MNIDKNGKLSKFIANDSGVRTVNEDSPEFNGPIAPTSVRFENQIEAIIYAMECMAVRIEALELQVDKLS